MFAKHIIRDDDVKAARIAHICMQECVPRTCAALDVRILRSDFFEHALPQAARVRHGIRLVAHQHTPAREPSSFPVAAQYSNA